MDIYEMYNIHQVEASLKSNYFVSLEKAYLFQNLGQAN